MSDEILILAKQYAATLGWRLIPLHAVGPRAKRPRGSRWPERATNDVSRIENWYASYVDDQDGVAFGIVTGEGSGVFVVDVDDENKGWTDLLADNDELPETVKALTGSGGTHLYFKYPEGKVISSGTNVPVKGVDIRAEGGQCVLPPAPHPSGNTYEWINDPFDTAVADCPKWLLKKIREAAGSEDFLALDAVWDTAQNEHIYHYARMLTFTDWSADEVRDHMMKKWRAGEIPDSDPTNPWTKASILEPTDSGIKQAHDQHVSEMPGAEKNGKQPKMLRFGSPLGLTDEDNALRIASYFDKQLLYATGPGWHVWDEQRWFHDREALLVGRFAERTTRRIQAEANLKGGKNAERLRKWAKASRNVSRIKAMVDLSRKQPTILIDHEELDGDETVELLNVNNGTLNLRTLELRDPDPADLITKVSPTSWDPDAECPAWMETLDFAFNGDDEMISFLQRTLGYSLTGLVPEHMFICWGALGMNGKSTILENFYEVVGDDYAKSFNARAVMASGGDNFALSTLAQMRGSRFATASETGEDSFLKEDLVKAMTGGDTLSVKFMRQDTFEYRPRFKVWVRTNNKPRVKSTDDPIWRRLILIPFSYQIPAEAVKPRHIVDESLRQEATGILRWACEGARDFFERGGMDQPSIVRAATAEYRAENDPIGQFIEQYCEFGEDESCFRSEFKKQLDWWVQDEFNFRKGPSTMKITEYLETRYNIRPDSSGSRLTEFVGISLKKIEEDWDGKY